MQFLNFLFPSFKFKSQFSLLQGETNSIQIPVTLRTLTLNIQKHALLMSTDPAESLTVETSPVRQLDSDNSQHGFPVTASHLHTAVWTLKRT